MALLVFQSDETRAFGVTPKAEDWAPEVGVVISLPRWRAVGEPGRGLPRALTPGR